MKIKKIEIPIYFGKLVLIQDKNWEKVNKKYKTQATKNFEAFFFKEEKKSGRIEYVVCFHKNVKSGTIAHEAVHVVNNIFKDRFINLDTENDEPQAYLTSWIVSEIENFLKKKK